MTDDFVSEEHVREAERQLADARSAEREFKHLEAAFAGLRQATLNEIVGCGPTSDNHGKIERLIITCQVMDGVKDMLLKAAQAGQMANHTLLLAEHISLRR